ncbi:MAG: DUF3048 domain-containing protein [Ruminococcaceae bacterium]|nr:DUF3048 domain-containing protein [Oscillospiraceae bacterium]
MANFKKTRLMKTLSLISALTLIVTAFSGCGGKEEEPTTTEPTTVITTEPPVVYRNPLTGEAGYNEELIGNRPVMVVVENHSQARPQWGLTSSDIVFEMVAEGGITRMILMYADASRLPDKIGPVRSTRHYFLDLAEGYDAIFTHFGQSTYAKQQLQSHDIDNINGYVDGSYFSRDKSRNVDSEHTAYTTKEWVTKAIEDKEYRTTLKDGYTDAFQFNIDGDKVLKDGSCVTATVSFSSGYTYTLDYDKQENVYYSSLNGNPFMDSNGTQQNFENIVILYTNISAIAGDTKNRVDFDLSEGEGRYISNGSYEDISWKKGDSTDMLKLYDSEGEELKLNTGRTYIAICDDSREANNTIS